MMSLAPIICFGFVLILSVARTGFSEGAILSFVNYGILFFTILGIIILMSELQSQYQLRESVSKRKED